MLHFGYYTPQLAALSFLRQYYHLKNSVSNLVALAHLYWNHNCTYRWMRIIISLYQNVIHNSSVSSSELCVPIVHNHFLLLGPSAHKNVAVHHGRELKHEGPWANCKSNIYKKKSKKMIWTLLCRTNTTATSTSSLHPPILTILQANVFLNASKIQAQGCWCCPDFGKPP